MEWRRFRRGISLVGRGPGVGGNSHIPGINETFAGRRRRKIALSLRARRYESVALLRRTPAFFSLDVPRDAQNFTTGQREQLGRPGRQTVAPSSIMA